MLEFRHTHHPISMNYYKVVLEHSDIKVVSLVFHLKLNGTTNKLKCCLQQVLHSLQLLVPPEQMASIFKSDQSSYLSTDLIKSYHHLELEVFLKNCSEAVSL